MLFCGQSGCSLQKKVLGAQGSRGSAWLPKTQEGSAAGGVKAGHLCSSQTLTFNSIYY